MKASKSGLILFENPDSKCLWSAFIQEPGSVFSGVLYKLFSGKAVKRLHKRSEAEEKKIKWH